MKDVAIHHLEKRCGRNDFDGREGEFRDHFRCKRVVRRIHGRDISELPQKRIQEVSKHDDWKVTLKIPSIRGVEGTPQAHTPGLKSIIRSHYWFEEWIAGKSHSSTHNQHSKPLITAYWNTIHQKQSIPLSWNKQSLPTTTNTQIHSSQIPLTLTQRNPFKSITHSLISTTHIQFLLFHYHTVQMSDIKRIEGKRRVIELSVCERIEWKWIGWIWGMCRNGKQWKWME